MLVVGVVGEKSLKKTNLQEIVMDSIGINAYINKTAKEMHRAQNVNLKYVSRKLSDEQKKQVIELFKKHVEDAAGAKHPRMCDEHLNWKLGDNGVLVLCGGGCCRIHPWCIGVVWCGLL